MDLDPVTSKKSHRRIGLRSLFVWIFYLSAGLTVAVNSGSLDWSQAAVGTASVTIAVGLAKQSLAIWRNVRRPLAAARAVRFAAGLEITWRLVTALLIGVILILQTLLNRKYLALPDAPTHISLIENIVNYPWWMLLLIAMSDAVSRTTAAASRSPQRYWKSVPIGIGLGMLAVFVIVDKNLLTFLTHVAIRDIDDSLAYTGGRYALKTTSQQVLFSLSAAGAVAAWLVATLLLSRALILPPNRVSLRRWLATLGVMMLAGAAAYDWWYYRFGYFAVSPDLARAGIASNWIQRLGGAFLACLLICSGTMRITRKVARLKTDGATVQIDLPPAGDSAPVAALLFAASAYFMSLLIQTNLDFASSWGWRWYSILGMVTYPDTLFLAAIGVLSFKLLRARWKGVLSRPLILLDLNPRQFVLSLLTLLIVLAVAVPTLAAFSFAFWLGPWSPW